MHVNSFSKFQMALPNHVPSPEDEKSFSPPMAVAELTCMSGDDSEESLELNRRLDLLFESFRVGKPIVLNEQLPILKIPRPLLLESHGSSFASEKHDKAKRSHVIPKYFLPARSPAKWIDLNRFRYWNAETQQQEHFFQHVSFVGDPDEILFVDSQNEIPALVTQEPIHLLDHTPDQKACFPNHYLSQDYVSGYEDHLLGRMSRFLGLSYYRHIIPRSPNGASSTGRDALVKHMKFLKSTGSHSLWKEGIAGQHASQSEVLCDVLFVEAGTTSLQDVLLALFILRIQYSDIRLSCCRGVEGQKDPLSGVKSFLDTVGLMSHPGTVDQNKLQKRRQENPHYVKEVRLKTQGYERFVKSAKNRCQTISRRKHPKKEELQSAQKSLQQLRMQYIFAEQECSTLEDRTVSSLCLDCIQDSIKYLETHPGSTGKFADAHLKYLKKWEEEYFI